MTTPLFKIRTHHPKGKKGDQLDHQAYAEVICKALNSLNDTHTGLTIGVLGDWGTGKSSVLKMLSEQLREKSTKRETWNANENKEPPNTDPDPVKQWIIVEFDAWHYTQQEELWLALLRKILDSVKQDLNWRELLWVNWQLVGKHRFNLQFLGSIITFIWRWLRFTTTILQTLSGNLLISLPEFPDAFPKTRSGFDQGQTIKVDEFRRDFQIIIESVEKPIIVLIDDLDRCPQDQIIPVLEAIKHFGFEKPLTSNPLPPAFRNLSTSDFLNSLRQIVPATTSQNPQQENPRTVANEEQLNVYPPLAEPQGNPDIIGNRNYSGADSVKQNPFSGVAFVLAVDRRAIERAVQAYYKDDKNLSDQETKIFASEYVEKIIQIPIELLPLHHSILGRLLATYQTKPLLETVTSTQFNKGIEEATKILSLGSKQNPRTILQTFNTFQLRWYLVVRRKLEEVINPMLLAGLLLLQYEWLGLFNSIYRNPYDFFYLHALANNKPNDYCTQVEIEEIYALGLPKQTDSGSLSIYFRSLSTNLLNLLRLIELPSGLNPQLFLAHLTLAKVSQSESTDSSSQETASRTAENLAVDTNVITDTASGRDSNQKDVSWQALLSGDPGRIKATAQSTPFVKSVSGLLLGQLGNALRYPNKNLEDIQSQETLALLFAFGRLNLGDFDVIVVNTVGEWARQNHDVHPAIIMRAIYMLSHHAVDQQRESSRPAIEQLQRIGLSDKQNEATRLRAIQLLSHCKHFEEFNVKQILRLFHKNEDKTLERSLLYDVAEKLVFTSVWKPNIVKAIEKDDTGKFADDFLYRLCRNYQNQLWPQHIARHFIQLSGENDQWFNQINELFRGYYDSLSAMTWLADCLPSNYDERQWKVGLSAIKEQQIRDLDWQDSLWKYIAQKLSRSGNIDLWSLYIDAILGTKHSEVDDCVLEIYRSLPGEQQRAIVRALENSSEELAEQILEKIRQAQA